MNTEALNQLRRVVLDAPEGLLVMNDFNTRLENGDVAHCAASWASRDQWFFEQGFDLPNRALAFTYLERFFRISPEDTQVLFGGSLDTLDENENVELVTDRSLVTANIDRLLAGQPTKRYPGAGPVAGRDE